ncbi:MAG: DUF2142 domain-containing protein [Anaerolineae bacterium]|nr:DUF2142 domain-containing protein [Anaerolineae bacterium]
MFKNLEAVDLKGIVKSIFIDNERLRGAELYLIITLLIFGVSACFLLPVSGGYDEESHLMRVWEMSSLTLLPNEKLGNKMPFPGIYWELSYRRKLTIRTVERGFWEQYGSLPLDEYDYIYSIKTRSVYAPPLLIPQAFVMRYLGRGLQWSALVVYYAIRLVGLLSYILLAWLAVRFIPYGKWVLALIAASPMAILQAATISADTISNGIAFFFIGGSLAIAQRKVLKWKDLTFLILLFLILFWGKINIIPLALLPLLILKHSQFKIRYGYIIILFMSMMILIIEVFGWNLLAYSRYQDALEGADPIGQILFILDNPFDFITIIVNNIRINFIDYIFTATALYPFNYWPVPIWTYYLFFIGLVSTLLIKDRNSEIVVRTRISLVIVFILAYLGTIISLYLSYTPVGSEGVRGVQGRYFLVVVPLLFIAVANLPLLKPNRISVFLPVIFGGMSLVLYITGMYLSYYVPCGFQYYMSGLCYQPGYKNWDPNKSYSDPISEQFSITQEIVSECSGLTEVRVWVDATDADPDGMIEFTLVDAEQDKIVTNVKILNSKLPNRSWYSLIFPPDSESEGKLYKLSVQEYKKGDVGPKIAYSSQLVYPEGVLYENDKVLLKDMIFQTGCEAAWRK